MMLAPAFASAVAMPSPMPLVEPVTTATRPCRNLSVILHLFDRDPCQYTPVRRRKATAARRGDTKDKSAISKHELLHISNIEAGNNRLRAIEAVNGRCEKGVGRVQNHLNAIKIGT